MNKVAIITGATSGIGAAITERMAREGYGLAIMARSPEVEGIARKYDAVAVEGSVTDEPRLRELVDATLNRYERIDIIVNNTGHAAKGELLSITDEQWRSGLDLLMLNVVRMARLVTPIMEQGGGGSLINISTFGTVEPDTAFPVSSAIRSAMESFAKMYATTYAGAGIRMNNVLPGFVNSYPESPEMVARIPLQRYADVTEIADLVLFLASDRSAYITGQSIRADGGMTRSL